MDKASELEKYFINQEMLRQFLEQLKKDFSFSEGLQSLDASKLQPNEVFDKVCLEVKKMMSKDYSLLSGALYRIDVNERELKASLNNADAGGEAEIITFMIMKRELQKVIFRNIHKSKTDEN